MNEAKSIWVQTCQIRERESLQQDTESEIVVIGAGMAGILIAYTLQRAGHQVIVLEADRIAGGQTRNTTAKITSQHGMIYHKLIQTLGKDKAKQYAMANETAIGEFKRIIESEGIDCDFKQCHAYVYGNNTQQLEAETQTAADLGLPAAFVKDTALPFPTAGAVRFSDQAQFHPLKFLKNLSDKLTIYEQTPVLTVENDLLSTRHGNIHAEKIIFACHYPFINFPGMYFARMHQERSYVLALKGAMPMEGMWIDAGKDGFSFRAYKDLLLLGGQGHRTGENSGGKRYDVLRLKAKEWFPGSQEVACWSAQDCMTPDRVPYIGRYTSGQPNWYIATGFQKWGMTSSMVSSMLLRDLIDGKENPYAKVFDPGRFEVSSIPGIAAEGGKAVRGLTKRFFQIPVPSEQTAHIPNGQSGIVSLKEEKIGVYKDEDGTLHSVSIQCPHLGCQLEWNPDERSWDCPCHGSRFDHLGNLISGPAQEGIRYE